MSKPKIGSIILADSLVKNTTNKSNVNGLTNLFYAWAFPCNRSITVIFSVFYCQPDTIQIFLEKDGDRDKIYEHPYDVATPTDVAMINVRLGMQFNSAGEYQLALRQKKTQMINRTPFIVQEREWPTFNEHELNVLRKNKGIDHAPIVFIKCVGCDHQYSLQENVLGEEVSKGTQAFPEDGMLKCSDCGNELNVRDLQGQMRQSVKDNVSKHLGK